MTKIFCTVFTDVTLINGHVKDSSLHNSM